MVLLQVNIPYGNYFAAGIFILAASTDGLDGYIARSRKEITNLGKIIDPLADKLLISAALISLVELHIVRAWVAFVVIARELAVTGLRAVAAAEGYVIPASSLGKVKTVTQIVAVIILLLKDLPISFLGPLGQLALYLALIITILSGVDYFYRAKDLLAPKE